MSLRATSPRRPRMSRPKTQTSRSKFDRLRVQYRLTSAELEVFALLLQGCSVKQIATLRGVGVATVRSQINALFDKTGRRSQRELIAGGWRSLSESKP